MIKNNLKTNIFERPLSKGKNEVSLSAFSFLFSEIVQYTQNRVNNVADLEKRLEDLGYNVGIRLLELLCFREKNSKREIRLLPLLQFIVSLCWKVIFGKAADALERSTENKNEYMIHENDPLTNIFISVPSDMGQFNCASYIAGIIKGILVTSGFSARVTAHTVDEEGMDKIGKTVFLLQFTPETMKREDILS